MKKAEQFNKWYADHCGHPHHVRFAKSVIDEQQLEIASLKAELEQHDDEITNIEIVNKELVALAKLSGATGFKDEMIAASRAMIHPHIEGVFAVYEIKLRERDND